MTVPGFSWFRTILIGDLRGLVGLASVFFLASVAVAQVPISSIQGPGTSSPLIGQGVTTTGIVTGFYYSSGTSRNGFWIQTPDGQTDGNAATSEAVYINDTSAPVGLAVGDLVTLSGTVAEVSGLTQLTGVSVLSRVAGRPLPAPVSITLPFTSGDAPERYECMRAVGSQALRVTDNYRLGYYGAFSVTFGGPRLQPTAVVAPGAAAQAMQAQNDLNLLLIDDGTSGAYPKPTPFLFGGSSSSEATLRLGDRVSGVTGIFSWFGFASSWGFVPQQTLSFSRLSARPSVPAVGGTLRVVGANVLNYFNGDGAGGGFPASRGASSAAEFARQRAHTIAALTALQADVLGLTEIENDGFGSASAIRDLVAGLDAAAGAPGTYSFVTYGYTGTDAITNAIIYRVATVEPVGAATSNTSSIFERPPLAQTFRERASAAKFTVCVNHFRSKSSGSGLNADQGDGQGAYNYRRVQQAQALATWLAGNPTGDDDPDVLILGDLNSYAREDPITALAAAGFASLLELPGSDPGKNYSYLFDGQVGALDHALATASLAAQVSGAAVWHNNAAEPAVLDYNVEGKNSSQQAINDGATPWRASDHDPLVVGLALLPPLPVIDNADSSTSATVGDFYTIRVRARGEGTLHYRWNKEGVPLGVDAPELSLGPITLADAGRYSVVVENGNGRAEASILDLVVLQRYDQWVATLGGSAKGPLEDADGDGRSNVVAYALGGADAPEPVLVATPTGYVFQYSRPVWATLMYCVVQQSTDLKTWTGVGAGSPPAEINGDLQIWRVPLTVSGPRVFARLWIELY